MGWWSRLFGEPVVLPREPRYEWSCTCEGGVPSGEDLDILEGELPLREPITQVGKDWAAEQERLLADWRAWFEQWAGPLAERDDPPGALWWDEQTDLLRRHNVTAGDDTHATCKILVDDLYEQLARLEVENRQLRAMKTELRDFVRRCL